MIKQINRTCVTFILLRPSGEMLIQLRDDSKGKRISYPGMWCFPGGVKEQGESYIDAVIREIREEFNLNVEKECCELLTHYPHDNFMNDQVYICSFPADSEPKLNEGKDMQWKNFREIKKLSMAWEQGKILQLLEKYLERHQIVQHRLF